MDNIHKINSKQNKDLIKDLEYLLEMAKQGEINTLVGSYIKSDDTMDNFLSGEYEYQCVNLIVMTMNLNNHLLKIQNGEV